MHPERVVLHAAASACLLAVSLGCAMDWGNPDRGTTEHEATLDPVQLPSTPRPVPPARPPAPPPPEPDLETPEADIPDHPLEVTLDGAVVPIRSVWATSRGGRSLAVVFSTRSRFRCADRARQIDETQVRARIYPRLASQGGGWSISDARVYGADGRVANGLSLVPQNADIDGTPSEGDRFEGGVHFETEQIRLRGRFEAVHCGIDGRLPAARPHPELHVSVGGETVPIRGARFLLQGDMVRLALSSAPSACGHRGGSDVRLEIRHYGRAPAIRQSEVHVSGDRLPNQRSVGFGDRVHTEIRFEYDPTLTPGTTVHAELGWEGDVRGVPVVVRGALDAPVCPPL